ncbi:hypothetical protein FBQ97_03930 [Acidobacteria bacterium ACD]|nr:hypothetical protein [Acidobacteria bacterium ACD]
MRRATPGLPVAGLAALLFLAPKARAERPPDFFAPLRGPTYVELDETYLLKAKGAGDEDPGLARLRLIQLRLRSYGHWSADLKAFWPERRLLLVTTPDGWNAVLESMRSVSALDGEPAPSYRIATRDGAVEVYFLADPDVSREFLRALGDDFSHTHEDRLEEEARQRADACRGHRLLLVAGDGQLTFSYGDRARRTVVVAADEVLEASLRPEALARCRELRDLLFRVVGAPEVFTKTRAALAVTVGWDPLVRGSPPAELVLAPDVPDPDDLSALRELTFLPTYLPRFVPPPEAPE